MIYRVSTIQGLQGGAGFRNSIHRELSGLKDIVSLKQSPAKSTRKSNHKLNILILMWVKHCHEPAMTGNGKRIPPMNGDEW